MSETVIIFVDQVADQLELAPELQRFVFMSKFFFSSDKPLIVLTQVATLSSALYTQTVPLMATGDQLWNQQSRH